jgi:hypothetical protein
MREGEAIDNAMTELRTLAGNINIEEMLTRAVNDNEEDDVENNNDDDVKDWVDECQEMSKIEVEELNADVQPVQMMLVKVEVGV